MGAVSECI